MGKGSDKVLRCTSVEELALISYEEVGVYGLEFTITVAQNRKYPTKLSIQRYIFARSHFGV